MQNLLSQKQAWERFGRMLDNLEKRLERTNEIQEQAKKFTQKAFKEFNGEIAAHHDEMSDREHSQVNGGEPIFYKGKTSQRSEVDPQLRRQNLLHKRFSVEKNW